ncbi:MAG: hypothetical protein HQ581_24500 [Planctomycetes bacterium]|nr:hypothetical protein [Planctomycetota bacterium]
MSVLLLILLLLILFGVAFVFTRRPRQIVSTLLPLALAAVLVAGGAVLLHFRSIPGWTSRFWPEVEIEDELPDSGLATPDPVEPPDIEETVGRLARDEPSESESPLPTDPADHFSGSAKVLRSMQQAMVRTFAGSPSEEDEPSIPAPVPVVAEAPDVPSSPAEPRPGWIGLPAQRVEGVYRMTVVVGPYRTRPMCDKALQLAVLKASHQYVEEYMGPPARRLVQLSTEYVTSQIVQATWEEPLAILPGTRFVLLHALLEFDDEVNAKIQDTWREAVVAQLRVLTGNEPGAPEPPATPAAEEPPVTITSSPPPAWTGEASTIFVGPYVEKKECYQALPEALKDCVAECLQRPDAGDRVPLDVDTIRNHVLVDEHWEKRLSTFGATEQPMHTLYVKVHFDADTVAWLKKRYRQSLIGERLQLAGMGLAAVLGVLALAFAYCKTDLVTAGKYRGRLRLLGVSVILATAAACTRLAGVW